MSTTPNGTTSSTGQYVLRYRSPRNEDRVFVFPCDPKGLVRMDDLSDRQFNDYLFARGMVGFEFDPPQVLLCELH